jgi:hypothetical protein
MLLREKTLSGNGHSTLFTSEYSAMPEKKLSIVMSGPEKSQSGKGGQGRLGAARANPNPE